MLSLMSSPVSPEQLDQAILDARAGRITTRDMVALLLQANIAIPAGPMSCTTSQN